MCKISNAKRVKLFFSMLTVSAFLITVLSPAELFSDSIPFTPQKGMCYATWDRDRFASGYSDESLAHMCLVGVDHLSLIVTQYQEKYNSTNIISTERTPSDKSLIHAAKTAHKLGLTVMLKPHIDLIDKYDGTYWRADIGFSNEEDWAKWFKEYRKFITHYAKLAVKMKADILCVGTELSFTTKRTEEWVEIISEIRKIFPGKLVYAANWDEFKHVKFWDQLDYAGIDAYFPLSYSPDPNIEDLKNGWKKWKNEIVEWHSTVNKPILFTELGYASTPSAPYSPWEGGTQGNADLEIQAKCYEAFFETIWKEPWFAGVYWWKWNPSVRSGGKYNRRFTPQNKPAEKIIEAHYTGSGTKSSRLALAK
ncbi:MAG: hypothetical protein WCV56_07185 [Candidatus Omnitrophota bacterium]